jgi:glycosyltransferase involved in cell wall biosynthesis
MSTQQSGLSILFVIDGIEFGGGERTFLQIALGLKDKFNISIASTAGGKFEDKVRRAGIHFWPVDMSRQLSVEPIRRLKYIVRNQKIDLIHSQGPRADFFSAIAARLNGNVTQISTITMPVDGFDMGPFKKNIYKLFDRVKEKTAKRFIVVSESLKQFLIHEKSIAPQKVVKICNGIEINLYNPNERTCLRNCKGEAITGKPIIGAIGRLVWQKGFEFLIKAIPSIAEYAPDVKCYIVGDGPLKSRLEQLIVEKNLNNRVELLGFCNVVDHLLSQMDMVVVPSLLEGFPMVTLEAMSMARPIVASRISGIQEQIENEREGILVPPADSKAIAEAVIRVLRDRKLADKIGTAAHRKVNNCFTVDKMIRETENVYVSVLP